MGSSARLLALSTALAIAAVASAGALARARADELARDLGHALLTVEGAREAAPVALRVNGLSLSLRSGTSAEPPARVLDELERRCAGATGFAALLPAGARAWLSPALGNGVLRAEHRDGGHVACFDPGHELDRAELIARLARFARTSDLATLGTLRFAWVEPRGDGSHYVAIEGAGSLRLDRAFPARGDAPGADLVGLPRPAGARRILSAGLAGDAPVLGAYRTAEPPAEAATRYASDLRARGLQVSAPIPGQPHRLVVAGERGYALSVAPEGGGSVLSLARIE